MKNPNRFEEITLKAIINASQMLLNNEAKTETEFTDALRGMKSSIDKMLEEYEIA